MNVKNFFLFAFPLAILLVAGSGILWLAQIHCDVGTTRILSSAQIQSLTEQQLRSVMETQSKHLAAQNDFRVTTVNALNAGGELVIGSAIWLLVVIYLQSRPQPLNRAEEPSSVRASGYPRR